MFQTKIVQKRLSLEKENRSPLIIAPQMSRAKKFHDYLKENALSLWRRVLLWTTLLLIGFIILLVGVISAFLIVIVAVRFLISSMLAINAGGQYTIKK